MQADDSAYDLGPGSSITIPAGTTNTFTVLTPAAKFLAVSMTDSMGRFFADLDKAGGDFDAVRAVVARHGVTITGDMP